MNSPQDQHESPAPGSRIDLLRILDANANRATEGLRVVEEYARFVLDDAHLSGLCKGVRHELAAAIAPLWDEARTAARQTQQDVGTQIATEAEYSRQNASDVATANFQRIEQSLRCLEEYGKPLDPHIARQVEALRYRVYTIQQAMAVTSTSRERLTDARLYVLLDGRKSPEEFTQAVRDLVAAGVNVIQLRDKTLSDAELLSRARLLREATRGSRTLSIINDRPDIALLSDSDGVHVGQDELSVREVRRVVGSEKLVGVSSHSLEQARQAVLDGADYIGVGPTFPSKTKQFTDFPGLDLLRSVAGEIGLPAFAIGGITLENLPEVLATGIKRVAVSGAITGQEDAGAAAREFCQQLLEGDAIEK